jgi:hypothetical protein
MKKLLTLLGVASALAAVTPAAAQNWNDPNAGGTVALETRIAQLDARLQAGIRTGVINRSEARALRQQIADLRRLHGRYSYNGLTRVERDDLRNRIRDTRQQLRLADNGRFDRDTRYGSWNDREWNNGYYGQGGPLEEVYCERRTGIGGVFDSVLGRNTCLQVGDPASGNLYAVPNEYRSQFRDNSYRYFRSDGRLIYEIDARTNRVARIHSID